MGAEDPTISCTLLTFRFNTFVSATRVVLSMALRMVMSRRLRSGGLEI